MSFIIIFSELCFSNDFKALIAPLFKIVVHRNVANNSELELLSEKLLRESDPNLFPYVDVNLQNSISSRSHFDDDAPFPWVFHIYFSGTFFICHLEYAV